MSDDPWYAIRTRSNRERTVSALLAGKSLEPYVPSVKSRRQWSDRVVEIDAPLFPGYVFCRFSMDRRVPVLTTPGVVFILGNGPDPAHIPEEEIEAVQKALASGRLAEPCPFLREGQHVRVTGGSMDGIEGILLRKKSQLRLIVSVELLQRSIAVEIESSLIQPI